MKNTTTVNVARSTESFLDSIRKRETEFEIHSEEEKLNFEYALLIDKAENYVNNFIKTNGTKAFLAERLRDGFIGELVHTNNGTSYIQSVRGRPYGTIVALKTDDDIVVGISYLDPEDMNKGHPIVGQYLALKRAEEGLAAGAIRTNGRYIKARAHKQIEHFEKRALAYFHPEKYSHSRGTDPVVYENFDEIHKRRAMILGE